MDSFLLNVWREVGAYLRYGDAKLLAVIGIATGFLYAQISFLSINDSFALRDVVLLSSVEVGSVHRISVALNTLSCTIGVASFFPTLSKYGYRTQFLLRVGTSFRIIPSRVGPARFVYFSEIAAFANLNTFRFEIEKHLTQGVELTEKQKQIAEQIYIVSRIAASKYSALYISTVLIAASFAMFLLGVVIQYN